MLESIQQQYGSAERHGGVQHRTDLIAEKRPNQMPPMWVLDKIADEKLSGGFNTKKSNICPDCFEAKSVNNSCGC